MISAKLMGGLANQMSQLAGTFAHAKRCDFECGFHLESCFTPLQGHPSTKYADNIFKNVPRIDHLNFRHQYQERRHNYDPLPVQDDLLIVNSYLQSWKYWWDQKEEIRKLFDVPPILTHHYNITGVHVRRGDYEKNPRIHPLCSVEYFREAMNLFDTEFLFFSDDMSWTRENFYGKGILYSSFYDEISDFRMLTHCKNIIGSNSTFSLWASYLNPNPEAKFVFPKEFYGPSGPDASDVVPPDYIRI